MGEVEDGRGQGCCETRLVGVGAGAGGARGAVVRWVRARVRDATEMLWVHRLGRRQQRRGAAAMRSDETMVKQQAEAHLVRIRVRVRVRTRVRVRIRVRVRTRVRVRVRVSVRVRCRDRVRAVVKQQAEAHRPHAGGGAASEACVRRHHATEQRPPP